jgi:hypothetical protein
LPYSAGCFSCDSAKSVLRKSRVPGDLGAPIKSLAAVVADHDVVVNATPGSTSLALVQAIGAVAFAGKVLVDVANVALMRSLSTDRFNIHVVVGDGSSNML